METVREFSGHRRAWRAGKRFAPRRCCEQISKATSELRTLQPPVSSHLVTSLVAFARALALQFINGSSSFESTWRRICFANPNGVWLRWEFGRDSAIRPPSHARFPSSKGQRRFAGANSTVMARLRLSFLSLVSCAPANRFYRSDDPLHRKLRLSIRVRVTKRMAGD